MLSRNQLSRPEDSTANRITLLTTGLRGKRQLQITPNTSRMTRGSFSLLDIRDDRLRERLTEIANKVVGEIPEENRYQRALALDAYLKSNGFLYSLDSQPKDTSIDPIEDFLVNTKRGHCEYFASALAMLLRSQNIPARLVVGFKNGEWNSLGEYYRFQQLHAHAWVEAYLRPEQIPTADRRFFDDWDNGAWLRLDPTPASTAETVTVATTAAGIRWSEIVDYAHYLWTSYVLRLDAKSQYDIIYLPLARLAKSLFQPQTWLNFFQRARHWMGIGGSNIRDWFNWRAGVAAMILSSLAVAVFRMVSYLLRRWFAERRAEHFAAEQREAIEVEFYRRFEELLAKYHFSRHLGQTPRELAAAVAQRIGSLAPALAVAGPHRVVDAFYRVRFGRQTLDNSEAQAVEHALSELEGVLQHSAAGSGS